MKATAEIQVTNYVIGETEVTRKYVWVGDVNDAVRISNKLVERGVHKCLPWPLIQIGEGPGFKIFVREPRAIED